VDLGSLCGPSFDVSMTVTKTTTMIVIVYMDPVSTWTFFDDDDDVSMIVTETMTKYIFSDNDL
jgi:hypothetical protein